MRLVFGMISLLTVLAVVGLLAKKQLAALTAKQDSALARQAAAVPAGSLGIKNPQLQSQQIQEQVRQSVEAAMQQPRTVDGE
ncbi:hypothetical protein [Polaromonas glacialis]|uniref:hypothetical protein n=1 Tax=Polaromonas glacialis TaxID=866564 RepID=UPI0004981BF5|nr:hypothetical protein [Polaromonas glacialis]